MFFFFERKGSADTNVPTPPLHAAVLAIVPDAGLIKLFLVFGFRGTPAELGLS